VVAPTTPGYGTNVICDLIPYELGGAVDLTFAAERRGLPHRDSGEMHWQQGVSNGTARLSVKLSRKGWRRAQRARRDAVLIAKVARSGRVGAAGQRLGTHSGCTSRANQPRRPVGGRRRLGRCG
jgi:hypothetical protein